MGMNTIKLNVGHTQYAGQATFFFYQKSATGVTSTEIDVFVNSGFIARMNPTEHFKISGASNTIDFVPVDPNNTATFITGDVGEEYGTAAVAGTVAISNDVQVIGTATKSKNNTAYSSVIGSSLNGLLSVSNYVFNPVANTKTYALRRTFLGSRNFNTFANLATDYLIGYGKFSGVHAGVSQTFKSLGDISVVEPNLHLSASVTGVTFADSIGHTVFTGSGTIDKEFDANPILLPPGGYLQFTSNIAAAGGVNDAFYTSVILDEV